MEHSKIRDFFLVEFNSTKDDKKVKISPIGEVVGLDRRVFVIDANSVIKNTKDRQIDIVLNKNHFDSDGAFGWFDLSSLEVKDDGIYASLELNNLGEEAVKNKHFRYLSPEYLVNSNREVVAIVGVGLVNQPNLLNKAMNKEGESREADDNCLSSVGLEPETPSKAPLTENNTSKQGEKMNDKKEDVSLQKELNTANAKVLTLQTEVNKMQNENKELRSQIEALEETNKLSKIDNAIANGELLPAQKEFALSLDKNSIDGYLASVKEANLQITQGMQRELNHKEKNKDDEDKEVNKELERMGW